MKALIIIFYLCGQPQGVLIHEPDSNLYYPSEMFPVFEQKLKSEDYDKIRMDIDPISEQICV